MKQKTAIRIWIIRTAYTIATISLLLYSYTQVDLSLTLSKASFVQTVQKYFQTIGYFSRPLSAVLFVSIVLFFFVLYAFVLRQAAKNKISRSEIWTLVWILFAGLLLSYPAFSYDFFNYLFTAKTVLIYHKNPYTVIPLQFSGVDPWLSFMHWTHLPSAYTPLWIGVTIPAYIFGFGYLLTLIWSLKVVIALAYIATLRGIETLLSMEKNKNIVLGMAVFAFNPLVIVETLVSPHNDILMMALVVWAMVLFNKKHLWTSWFVLSLSVAMKLMTLVLIPSFFLKWNKKITLLSMLVGFGAVLTQREVLSWYWLWIVPFVALMPESRNTVIVSAGISLGLLLRYAPFLYLGNWDAPASVIKLWVTVLPVAVSVLIVLGRVIPEKIRTNLQKHREPEF